MVTVFLTTFGGAAYADFQDGVNAADKGDWKTVFKEWQPLADQGNASAQYNLGVRYAKGRGVLKDMTKAKYWIKKAYEGNDTAASNLAKENWERFELWKY